MPFPQYTSDTDVYVMTSIAEMQQELSFVGWKLHLDDLDPTDPNYLSGADALVTSSNMVTTYIQRATSQVMENLGARYKIADIYLIPRIREIATYIALYKLTARRGNQPLFENQYLNALDTLEDYKRGDLYLKAPSNGNRAYCQSSIIDLRFNLSPNRIIPTRSTQVQSGQNTIVYLPFWWL